MGTASAPTGSRGPSAGLTPLPQGFIRSAVKNAGPRVSAPCSDRSVGRAHCRSRRPRTSPSTGSSRCCTTWATSCTSRRRVRPVRGSGGRSGSTMSSPMANASLVDGIAHESAGGPVRIVPTRGRMPKNVLETSGRISGLERGPRRHRGVHERPGCPRRVAGAGSPLRAAADAASRGTRSSCRLVGGGLAPTSRRLPDHVLRSAAGHVASAAEETTGETEQSGRARRRERPSRRLARSRRR